MNNLEIKQNVEELLANIGITNRNIKCYPYLVKLCIANIKYPLVDVKIFPVLTKRYGKYKCSLIYRSMRFLIYKKNKLIRNKFRINPDEKISVKKFIELITLEVIKNG